MTTAPAGPDPTMQAIGHAVAEGRAGDSTSARQKLLSPWSVTGVTGDPLHRCSLAHYLAISTKIPPRPSPGTSGPWTLPTP